MVPHSPLAFCLLLTAHLSIYFGSAERLHICQVPINLHNLPPLIVTIAGETPPVVDDPQLNKPPVIQIYEKLRDLFGNGQTDIFQMGFPARLLEQGNYDYVDSDSFNAQQIKPPAVVEAEFRLMDDMFSISSIVGGPNGGKFGKNIHIENCTNDSPVVGCVQRSALPAVAFAYSRNVSQ